jgi:hypothetical protein
MTKKKQLDCELNCKATAEVKMSILKDLVQPDVPMDQLLKEVEIEDETKDNDETSI